MQPLKEAYLPLLTARQEELSLAELGEGISQAGQGLAAWTEQATRSLWAKLWEDAPQPAPEVDLTAWQGLEGAGGWLGSGRKRGISPFLASMSPWASSPSTRWRSLCPLRQRRVMSSHPLP